MEPQDDTQALLENALTNAFSPPPSRRQSALIASAPAVVETLEPTTTVEIASPGDSGVDSWRAEYDSQVETWRAQSAEARTKAERERERWEAIRTEEKLQGRHTETSWESLSQTFTSSEPSRSGLPAPSTDAISTPAPSHSRHDTGEDSQKWEEVPSVTSSFPSLTYPENVESSQHHTPKDVPAVPASVTLSVFDSSLSTGLRVKALFSSLAINLALPFVNGVMLGFGEIFAKNVILGWLGWKSPSPTTTVGIRQTRPR